MTATPTIGRSKLSDISTIRPGFGLGSLPFGASIGEAETYFGQPDSKETHELADEFTVAHSWAIGVICWFDSDEHYRLSTIQVDHKSATIEGLSLIGRPRAQVLEDATSILGGFELEDWSSIESPDYWLAAFDSPNVNLWFSGGLLTSIQWGYLFETDGNTPKWPE